MRLEPGPIPELRAAESDFPVEAPGFLDVVKSELADLPGMEDNIDLLKAGFDDLLSTDVNGIVLGALGDADTELPNHTFESYFGSIDDTVANIQGADELLPDAWSVTPGEAFQQVPEPLAGPGAAPAAPVLGAEQVTLVNLSRPAATDFRAGDRVEFDIRLQQKPGGGDIIADVAVTGNFFRQDASGNKIIEMGKTDALGFLRFGLTFDDGWIGKWALSLELNRDQGGAFRNTIEFVVDASTAGPVPSDAPLFATLANLTERARDLNFRVGDRWELVVTGKHDKDVEISGTYNRQPLTPLVLGQTNSAGRFVLDGSMSEAEVGDWTEQYKVGGEQVPGGFTFTVSR